MKILYKPIKYISISVLFISLVGAGQFSQYLHSNDDVRKYALEHWAVNDKERQKQMVKFIQTCLVGEKYIKGDFNKEMEMQQSGIFPEPHIKMCAEKNGYTDVRP
ncbi:hypothetical protein [Shewanella glacialipiscicola]|jgi:hypothetical protein|uniref:hypothetical protein n=1 Tax=Shewanella glacialipiscicola TaxID=614069 RepID=UPI003D7BD32E